MAPRSSTPTIDAPAVAVAPRQWKCEEQPELRLYLANLSYRPTRKELGLPPEDFERHRLGFNFIEEYAQFRGGKFVTSDPATQAELARIELAGLAPIFEDYASDGFVCRVHNFVTLNERAWQQHLKVAHKVGAAPAILDVANDEVGAPVEQQYEMEQ